MKIEKFMPAVLKSDIVRTLETHKSPKKSTKNSILTKKDTVEISIDPAKIRLEEIKKKISSGFYSSSVVRNDLTEKLSHVLDDITG